MKLNLLLLVVAIVSCSTLNQPKAHEVLPGEIVESSSVTKSPLFEVDKSANASYKNTLEGISNRANCLVRDPVFLAEIEAHSKPFTMTSDTPLIVANKLRQATAVAFVSTYYKRLTSVVAYRMPSGNTIFYNTKSINSRSVRDNVATAIHEYLHVLGYTHGTVITPTDFAGVNYTVGEIAAKSKSNCLN